MSQWVCISWTAAAAAAVASTTNDVNSITVPPDETLVTGAQSDVNGVNCDGLTWEDCLFAL